MKILIIGDVHFGSSSHLGKEDLIHKVNTRLLDYFNTLNDIIDQAIQLDVRTVVFTGDYFRDSNPSKSQLNYFSRCLMRLSKAGISVLLVIGNHDQSMKLASDSAVSIFKTLEMDGVKVMDTVETHIDSNEKGDHAIIISMPYRNLQMLEVLEHSEALHIIQTKFESVLQYAKTLNSAKIIVVGHYLVEGVQKFGMELTGVEKEVVLPVSMFNDVDFTVMGHVHNAQWISENPPIYFCGSIDRIDYGEAKDDKSVLLLDIKGNSQIEYSMLPVKARPLYHIKVDLVAATLPDKPAILSYIRHLVTQHSDLNDAIIKITIEIPEEQSQMIDHDDIFSTLKDLNIYYIQGVNIIKRRSISGHVLSEGINAIQAIDILSGYIKDDVFRESVKKRALEVMGYKIESVTDKS